VILLVSPDPAFARTYAHRLAIARHRTVTVGTAADALLELERRRFDVILLEAGVADEQLLAHLDRTPTIVLLNHTGLDDVLAAVDAIAPTDDVPIRA
jgi:DNA-binding response OmpR family regulator